jgi:serine/threonine protein kinase
MGQGAPSSGAAKADASPVKQGDILAGKYRVERVLGVGGMGVVVAATHIDLLERRAIKFMLAAQLGDSEAVERFLREARASSRLKSEHVAKVHDVGRLENGAPYLVMEYLTGGDLRVLLKRRGAIPPHEAALYVLQACEALAEAHGGGIVHRDMKPENLFLTKRPDGTPSIKVLDFGISKVLGAGSDMGITSTQAILGSPYYMSPEQLRASRDVDTRTDIWSLGVILYQLVTNNLPFSGANLTALIASVIYGRYTPASEVKIGLSGAIDPIIARCLERDVERRYPTVAELAEDLLPLAPTAGRESFERILRLLRPNSSNPSDRLVMGSYDAPSHPPAPLSPQVTHPVSSEPETVPKQPGKEGAGFAPITLTSSGDRTRNDGPARDPSAPQLSVSGSVVNAEGSTMRSGDVLATSAGGDSRNTTGADWANGVPSVRVVVQPSRAPWIILAIGGALSLVIVSVGFLFTRSPVSLGETPKPPAQPLSVSLGETPKPPAQPPAPSALAATSAPAVVVAVAPLDAPSPSGSAGSIPSARHLFGKLPTKAAPSGEPAKPPSAGDPFGAGRQ